MSGSSCQICNSSDFAEIAVAREYTSDQPLHVCKGCGFVQVLNRRPSAEIASDWDDAGPDSALYAANLASVEARHAYVARTIQDYVTGKRVCDIGAGCGTFLALLRDNFDALGLLGVSPSAVDCAAMAEIGIPSFQGLAENCDFTGYDTATLIWTLENTGSCKATVSKARTIVGPGGHVVVATGSRLLVPFKKPLDSYLGKAPLDLHPWRFSKKTLIGLLRANALDPVFVNRYIDGDHLVVVAKWAPEPMIWKGDDYKAVLKFFRRWHWATQHYV